MRKSEMKTIDLSMGMLVFLSGCSIKKSNNTSSNTAVQNNSVNTNKNTSVSTSQEQSLGSVTIKYNLSYIRKLASNQVAVWIEDFNGNYIPKIINFYYLVTSTKIHINTKLINIVILDSMPTNFAS